jgi:hypothetical protein
VPNGLPPPEAGELAFTITLQTGDRHQVGETPYGTRRFLDVDGGTFDGARISGTVLSGGLEYELTLANGALELEQIALLRTSDGANIYMRTCGFAAAGDATARFVPDIEAPNSSRHTWLNTSKFAGIRTVNERQGTVELKIYDISAVNVGEPTVQLRDPSGVPNQPWNCSTANASRGNSVLSANVTLGGSVSVGASKRGSRNIIPITGGTVSGRVSGRVVPGGADYQLSSGNTVLDARYSLQTNDGEYILVRNCGPFGAMVPRFEARANGPYAYLNEDKYLSSDPGVGAGGVSLTFYERR